MTNPGDPTDQLIDAALGHVVFDGWSDATFRAAIAETEVDPTMARSLFPRGAVDLALAFHRRADRQMVAALKALDLSELRFRDRIARAVQLRIEAVAPHKDAVRRGVALFALPQHAADGVRAMWETVDLICDTLGDPSEDINWYTKRATLSGVYSSTVLYWLGDDSPDQQATWEFLDRRIENVMQIEKIKAAMQTNPAMKPFMAVPNWLAKQVRRPGDTRFRGMPGSVGRQD